jgi:uncharacterized membrane protein
MPPSCCVGEQVRINFGIMNPKVVFQRSDFRLFVVLCLALLWCGALIALRAVRGLSFEYLFLVWNLFLATISLFFSSVLTYLPFITQRRKIWLLESRWKVLFAGLWLLFFPNAPYIVTDLVHLRNVQSAPLWVDVLMVSSCAATGLALGYTSLFQMHGLFHRANRPRLGYAFLAGTFLLSGFGIYLGRFQRWSSADIFRRPLSPFADISDRLLNPFHHPRTWGVTIGFAIFLAMGYALLLFMQGAQQQAELSRSRDRNLLT